MIIIIMRTLFTLEKKILIHLSTFLSFSDTEIFKISNRHKEKQFFIKKLKNMECSCKFFSLSSIFLQTKTDIIVKKTKKHAILRKILIRKKKKNFTKIFEIFSNIFTAISEKRSKLMKIMLTLFLNSNQYQELFFSLLSSKNGKLHIWSMLKHLYRNTKLKVWYCKNKVNVFRKCDYEEFEQFFLFLDPKICLRNFLEMNMHKNVNLFFFEKKKLFNSFRHLYINIMNNKTPASSFLYLMALYEKKKIVTKYFLFCTKYIIKIVAGNNSKIFQAGNVIVLLLGKIFFANIFLQGVKLKGVSLSHQINRLSYNRFSGLIYQESVTSKLNLLITKFSIFVCPVQKSQNDYVLILFPCTHLISSIVLNRKKDKKFFHSLEQWNFSTCLCCNLSKNFVIKLILLF